MTPTTAAPAVSTAAAAPTETVVRSSSGLPLAVRTSGSGGDVLVGLHGGPGGGDYLGMLHRLAGPHRRVVTFDQLGAGRSGPVPEDHVWSVEEAAADVDAVRAAAGVERVDVVGHSWGGMLALQYALDFPHRVRRQVLWSTVPSVSRMVAGFLRQLAAVLPDDELAGAVDADAFGRHDDPLFRRAVSRWLAHWFDPDPTGCAALLEEVLTPDAAARGLWGSRLWLCDGALRGWDVEHRLPELTQQTLLVHGDRDTSGHDVNRVLAHGLPCRDWVVLPGEAHMPGDAGLDTLLRLVAAFLRDTGPDPAPRGAGGDRRLPTDRPVPVEEWLCP